MDPSQDFYTLPDEKLREHLLKLHEENKLDYFLASIRFHRKGMTIPEILTTRNSLTEWRNTLSSDSYEFFESVVIYPNNEEYMVSLFKHLLKSETIDNLIHLKEYMKGRNPTYNLARTIASAIEFAPVDSNKLKYLQDWKREEQRKRIAPKWLLYRNL